MRRILCLLAIITLAAGAQATVYFDIAPASGFTEPLSPGDVIEIDIVTQPGLGGEAVLASYWDLYYNAIPLGEVTITPGLFTFNGSGVISGSASLDVGMYTMATSVGLHIHSHVGTSQYHSYSNNMLQVLATDPMVPSTSAWGLIILLLAIPAVVIWRR